MLPVPTSFYLLLGSLYLFLSFLSLRNMFLLLGILTWLSVRVPRGSLGICHESLTGRKGYKVPRHRALQETENSQWHCSLLLIERLYVWEPSISVCLFWKKTLQRPGCDTGWKHSVCKFNMQIFCYLLWLFPSAVMIKAVTPWVRKSEIFQSDLTSHQGLRLTELLSQVGTLKNIS